MIRRTLAFLFAVVAAAASGCRDSQPSGTLEVFAAASLTDAFTEIGALFEAQNDNVDVRFNFAASSALARQINEDAPADVFASADEENMRTVTDSGNARTAQLIARNRLAVVVEPGNPKGIARLADLSAAGVILVVCAPEVPCGKLATAVLAKASVAAQPASLEENVRAVVAKVALGEADAGIVYQSDVRAAADQTDGVDIDIAADPALEARYMIAAITGSKQSRVAKRWIAFTLSPAGARILAKHGFLVP